MKANKFNSDTLKNAITIKIKKIIIARITQTHLAPELLNAEKAHRAKIVPIANTISCIKLIENHIIEKATQAKNHFFICCGNITFMSVLCRN